MKKGSLSVIFVKTLLAVLLFAGMGTIIIGGGYIIGEYSKNRMENKIWNFTHKCSSEHPESCDKSCQIDDDCYPSCTYDCGCLRSGEICDDSIKCVVAPFSCKCENNECEIVEYEYKAKLLESAEILGILYPLEIIETAFYSDGGTTGVISKDANNKNFFFCFDGRMQINEIGKKMEPYHIYLKVGYPTDPNSQKISIAGEEEKALLNILQDWINKQTSREEQIRLSDIRTVVGLSEKELKIYRILKMTKELEDRNKIDSQIDTSDWQTYRNEEFGFEVKYPEDWKAIEEDEGVLFFDNPFYANEYKLFEGPGFESKYGDYAFINIGGYPEGTQTVAGTVTKDTEIKDFVCKLYSKDCFISKEMIIGGQKAYMFGYKPTLYFKQNNDIRAISMWSGPEYTDHKKLTATFYQILSSFKFIEN